MVTLHWLGWVFKILNNRTLSGIVICSVGLGLQINANPLPNDLLLHDAYGRYFDHVNFI